MSKSKPVHVDEHCRSKPTRKKAPVKKAPAKKAPVKKAPVKKKEQGFFSFLGSPTKKAPAKKKATTKKAPARKAVDPHQKTADAKTLIFSTYKAAPALIREGAWNAYLNGEAVPLGQGRLIHDDYKGTKRDGIFKTNLPKWGVHHRPAEFDGTTKQWDAWGYWDHASAWRELRISRSNASAFHALMADEWKRTGKRPPPAFVKGAMRQEMQFLIREAIKANNTARDPRHTPKQRDTAWGEWLRITGQLSLTHEQVKARAEKDASGKTYPAWVLTPKTSPHKPTPAELATIRAGFTRGEARARHLMDNKPKKKDITDFVKALPESEYEGAKMQFHRASPRMWGFFVAGDALRFRRG